MARTGNLCDCCLLRRLSPTDRARRPSKNGYQWCLAKSFRGGWHGLNDTYSSFPSRRKDQMPCDHGADAIEGPAPGDVERFAVLAAESAVGHLIGRHWQEREQLAGHRVDDVDATLHVRGRLERRVGLVQSGGHVQPALIVLLQSVGTTPGAPVVDEFLGVQFDRAVVLP